MLDPQNLVLTDSKPESIIDTISFNTEIPDYDQEEYDYFDSKSFKTYMADLEKTVRGSLEYRNLISYCRENMNMNKCSFFENVNNIDTFKIKIELHHTPFGLYDICKTVFNKRCRYHEEIDVESVAEEVIMLHYYGLVGLIPLSETVHDMVHNQYLFVPCQYVMGRYEDFYNLYEEFIEPENKDVYNRIKEYSEFFDPQQNLKLLQRNYIHIDFSGAYNLPKLEDIYLKVNQTINRIRDSYSAPQPIEQSTNIIEEEPILRNPLIMIA